MNVKSTKFWLSGVIGTGLLLAILVGISPSIKGKDQQTNATADGQSVVAQEAVIASITKHVNRVNNSMDPDTAETGPVVSEGPEVIAEAQSTATDLTADGEIIYTLATIPTEKCGTYWVRDEQGDLAQVSVCGHGDGSQAGCQ